MLFNRRFVYTEIMLLATVSNGYNFHIRIAVPNFKIARITTPRSRKSSRDMRPAQFNIDGRIHKLHLVRSERQVFTPYIPIWAVSSTPNKYPDYTYNIVDKVCLYISI